MNAHLENETMTNANLCRTATLLALCALVTACTEARDRTTAYLLYAEAAELGGVSMQIAVAPVEQGDIEAIESLSLGEIVGTYDEMIPWIESGERRLQPTWERWDAPEYRPSDSSSTVDAPDGRDQMLAGDLLGDAVRYELVQVTVQMQGESHSHRALVLFGDADDVVGLWDPVMISLGRIFEHAPAQDDAVFGVSRQALSAAAVERASDTSHSCNSNWVNLEGRFVSDEPGFTRAAQQTVCRANFELGARGTCTLRSGVCEMESCLALHALVDPGCRRGTTSVRDHDDHYVSCPHNGTVSKGLTSCTWLAMGVLGVSVNEDFSVSITAGPVGGSLGISQSGAIGVYQATRRGTATCIQPSAADGGVADGGDGGRSDSGTTGGEGCGVRGQPGTTPGPHCGGTCPRDEVCRQTGANDDGITCGCEPESRAGEPGAGDR